MRPASAQFAPGMMSPQVSRSQMPPLFPAPILPGQMSGGYISDAMTQSSYNQAQSVTALHLEEENKRLKAKIVLLERKIRVKDQLFDDSLSSSFAGCAATNGAEYTSLIQKLKKRVMTLQNQNDQSELEIQRLTKTVKVVEVEVTEDNEPFKKEIQRLSDLNSSLQVTIEQWRKKFEIADGERQKLQSANERLTQEIANLNQKMSNLQHDLSQANNQIKIG